MKNESIRLETMIENFNKVMSSDNIIQTTIPKDNERSVYVIKLFGTNKIYIGCTKFTTISKIIHYTGSSRKLEIVPFFNMIRYDLILFDGVITKSDLQKYEFTLIAYAKKNGYDLLNILGNKYFAKKKESVLDEIIKFETVKYTNEIINFLTEDSLKLCKHSHNEDVLKYNNQQRVIEKFNESDLNNRKELIDIIDKKFSVSKDDFLITKETYVDCELTTE